MADQPERRNNYPYHYTPCKNATSYVMSSIRTPPAQTGPECVLFLLYYVINNICSSAALFSGVPSPSGPFLVKEKKTFIIHLRKM
jgi:hypothetical protein